MLISRRPNPKYHRNSNISSKGGHFRNEPLGKMASNWIIANKMSLWKWENIKSNEIERTGTGSGLCLVVRIGFVSVRCHFAMRLNANELVAIPSFVLFHNSTLGFAECIPFDFFLWYGCRRPDQDFERVHIRLAWTRCHFLETNGRRLYLGMARRARTNVRKPRFWNSNGYFLFLLLWTRYGNAIFLSIILNGWAKCLLYFCWWLDQ